MTGKTYRMMEYSIFDLLSGKEVQWFLPGRKFDIIDMYRISYPSFDFSFRVKGDILMVRIIK